MISSLRTIARTSFLAAAVLAAASLWVPEVEAREWPAPKGHVSDFAGVVDQASADSIEALGVELKEKTGAELAVVTLSDLGGETIDPVAVDLYKQWGIGRKEKDDGVLILLGLAERRVRIEVGYGLEGILPDGKCGTIIRRVMGPDLHADRFGPGLLRGAEAVAGVIANDRGVTLERGLARDIDTGDSPSGLGILFLVFLVIILPIAVRVARQSQGHGGMGPWAGGRRRGWQDPWGGFGGGLGGLGGFGGGGGGGGGGGFGGFGGGKQRWRWRERRFLAAQWSWEGHVERLASSI